jgi:hypothetical protein
MTMVGYIRVVVPGIRLTDVSRSETLIWRFSTSGTPIPLCPISQTIGLVYTALSKVFKGAQRAITTVRGPHGNVPVDRVSTSVMSKGSRCPYEKDVCIQFIENTTVLGVKRESIGFHHFVVRFHGE